MIRRDDEELIERYQRAHVTARTLTRQADRAQGAGKVDYLAEIEAAMNRGQAAAYFWLLGGSPVSPQRRLGAEVNDQTMIAEYQAAQAEIEAGKARYEARVEADGHSYDIDEAATYAEGVQSALFWALTRTGAVAP